MKKKDYQKRKIKKRNYNELQNQYNDNEDNFQKNQLNKRDSKIIPGKIMKKNLTN